MQLHTADEKECKALEKKYRYLDYEDMSSTFALTVTLFVTTNYQKKPIQNWLGTKNKTSTNTFLSFENVWEKNKLLLTTLSFSRSPTAQNQIWNQTNFQVTLLRLCLE